MQNKQENSVSYKHHQRAYKKHKSCLCHWLGQNFAEIHRIRADHNRLAGTDGTRQTGDCNPGTEYLKQAMKTLQFSAHESRKL